MQGETAALSLPALSSRKVPKRYEETRPVAVQGFAHTRIIGLGHELHKREQEKAELEKLQSIREAELAVWQEADKVKVTAVHKAQDEAAIEQEKVIKKLKKVHAKALLEEALKVEMAMQKLAIEQVKMERAEGEKRLKIAVAQTEARCHKELLEAVVKARDEERKIAADKAADVARSNKEKFETAMKRAENNKIQALKELRDTKDLEKAKAVQDAEVRERKIAKDKCDALNKEHKEEINLMSQVLEDRNLTIRKLNNDIQELEGVKSNVETCLMDTRKDFQDFIDTQPPFDRRQADFLTPVVYLDELEKKGYDIKPLRPPKVKTKSKKK